MHISSTPTSVMSTELSFSRSHTVWMEDQHSRYVVFKPQKLVILEHLFKTGNIQSICFKVYEIWISKSLHRAVAMPLIHHPNSWYRFEVRCNTVFVCKAHFEFLQMPHQHATIGSLCSVTQNTALYICCCVHIEDEWFDYLCSTDYNIHKNKNDFEGIVHGGQRYLPTLHWGDEITFLLLSFHVRRASGSNPHYITKETETSPDDKDKTLKVAFKVY